MALLSLAFAGTSVAEDRIRYEEIPAKIAPFGTVISHRGIKVTTVDGKEHNGRGMRLDRDQVMVSHGENSWEALPSEQVARIEISQGGRFFHHIVNSAEIPLAAASVGCEGLFSDGGNPACLAPATAVFSPVWAYTAATAPFYLVADFIAFLIPPKVVEIAH